MIISRKMNYTKEKDFVTNILNKNGVEDEINSEDHIYVLEENGIIIGITKVTFKSATTAFLEYLIIDKSKRGEDFGDGLLRAVLNYCMAKGINLVYFSQYNNYLINKGFEEEHNGILKCDLHKFFSKGCSFKGR